jgi:parallel beta-helix repeat protein
MKRESLVLALLVALPVTLLGVDQAQAATKISSFGFEITAPGVYTVTQDLSGAGTGIRITASNVDLHLGNHTLTGDGSAAGIDVLGGANVSIQQGTIQNFSVGIHLVATLDSKLRSLTVRQNGSQGIWGERAIGATVTNNTANNNGDNGILFNGDARSNLVVHNTANSNGTGGINFVGGVFANTVTDNTTNQNGFAGILVGPGAVTNTVTANTAIRNGDRGITLISAYGTTVARNTTDQNGSAGIDIVGDSHDNSVTRNSATANGDGVRILDTANQNTVQDNTLNANFRVGIYLGPGAAANTIRGNTANLNTLGIWLEPGATSNTIQGNTALSNGNFDLGDQNPKCDSNAWANNKFATDNVAGASDGGPSEGCIR